MNNNYKIQDTQIDISFKEIICSFLGNIHIILISIFVFLFSTFILGFMQKDTLNISASVKITPIVDNVQIQEEINLHPFSVSDLYNELLKIENSTSNNNKKPTTDSPIIIALNERTNVIQIEAIDIPEKEKESYIDKIETLINMGADKAKEATDNLLNTLIINKNKLLQIPDVYNNATISNRIIELNNIITSIESFYISGSPIISYIQTPHLIIKPALLKTTGALMFACFLGVMISSCYIFLSYVFDKHIYVTRNISRLVPNAKYIGTIPALKNVHQNDSYYKYVSSILPKESNSLCITSISTKAGKNTLAKILNKEIQILPSLKESPNVIEESKKYENVIVIIKAGYDTKNELQTIARDFNAKGIAPLYILNFASPDDDTLIKFSTTDCIKRNYFTSIKKYYKKIYEKL